ncbi:MAG: hypothetical protein KUA43_08855 [Hoeflea sp.]|uniref:hypothetical protein n=1 Tax=Hoeflea sp. TaxID=1940281 RepID=UPI001DA0DA10|nr:hypothetical protein [Hoeflea sp.]MBU4529774.1 hypothetical protein [Alphaproteobacteria bacterium]MBU4543335.1 hypothetical protein [Alphaproteobacteria bacterium]MBU4552522.1 hypothetical protein [Alphaproteobacteria bacterium]MBV1723538.1 hypothetical protein [Hoeflea sp.]MBV1762987.1 hypothetical protein [Hoeflea sp.]
MRDLANNIGAVQAVAPAVLSATDTSAAIDLLGFESAALILNTGAIVSAGDFTAKLQESDTTTGGDFADVAAAHLVGTLPATLEAASVYRQGYIGTKRYLRTVITKNGGTSIAAGAVIVKGHPHDAPVA